MPSILSSGAALVYCYSNVGLYSFDSIPCVEGSNQLAAELDLIEAHQLCLLNSAGWMMNRYPTSIPLGMHVASVFTAIGRIPDIRRDRSYRRYMLPFASGPTPSVIMLIALSGFPMVIYTRTQLIYTTEQHIPWTVVGARHLSQSNTRCSPLTSSKPDDSEWLHLLNVENQRISQSFRSQAARRTVLKA